MSEKDSSCEPWEEMLPSLAELGLLFSTAHVYESLWLSVFVPSASPWHGPQFMDTDLEMPFPCLDLHNRKEEFKLNAWSNRRDGLGGVHGERIYKRRLQGKEGKKDGWQEDGWRGWHKLKNGDVQSERNRMMVRERWRQIKKHRAVEKGGQCETMEKDVRRRRGREKNGLGGGGVNVC